MLVRTQPKLYTPQEYLALEEGTEDKSQEPRS